MAILLRLLPGAPDGVLEKVAKNVFTLAGQNRFGMKLDAVHRPAAMPQSHDVRILARSRGDLEDRRQPGLRHHQRMVSRGDEWSHDAAEHAVAVVLDGRGLAVH